MVDRYNADLANDFGNLASRVLSMIGRYLDGRLPAPPNDEELTAADRELRDVQTKSFAGMEAAVDAIAPHQASKAAWTFVRKANAYVEDVAPWALNKDPAERRRLEVVLYMLADSLRHLAAMTSPLTPRAAQELWRRLGQEGEVASGTFVDLRWGGVEEGTRVETGEPLFPRLEVET
jgi:methionyl-tRNA synthetase